MTRIAILALASLALVSALVGCGRQGDLERPTPGPRERADIAAQQRHAAETASNATATNTAIPPQNPAIEPYTNPGPIQSNPIPGARRTPWNSSNPGPQ